MKKVVPYVCLALMMCILCVGCVKFGGHHKSRPVINWKPTITHNYKGK